MRVAVIGVGNVGKTIFYNLQHIRMINEIVLVGRNIEKVKAEVMDAADAATVWGEYGPKLHYGGYKETEGADIIIYAAGSSKMVSDRMELLHDNCLIAEEAFTEINRYNKDAIIINITNPLDVITLKIQQVTGRDPGKVIGTGTLLESARLTRFVADFLELSSRSIQTFVIGEHGTSAVALLSSVRISGTELQKYMQTVTDESLALNTKRLNEVVINKGYQILYGKGYTNTGVAAAACRIATAIATDSREVLPVSSVLQGEYGVNGIAISVPSVVGRNGIEEIRETPMSPEEREAFLRSADTIRNAAALEGLV